MANRAWRALRHLAAAVGLLIASGQLSHAEPLPALDADLSRTSVSGLSSGAFMAAQFQVAYSKMIIGAGIVAGGPYGCAYTPGIEESDWGLAVVWNAARALKQCMEGTDVPSASSLSALASWLADNGAIDKLDGLSADRMYLFWGGRDTIVARSVMDTANDFFVKAGVPAANIAFVINGKASHAFITDESGPPCGALGIPYINNCDYDQAGALLTQIYGTLRPAGKAMDASYITFDQEPFSAGFVEADFSKEGVAYIPADCRAHARCAVHIVFHSCEQGRTFVGDSVVKGTEYAKWAETNRLIILFPQVQQGPLNPKGCWDWWGYTGPHFLEHKAPQMLAVRRMLNRLGTRQRPGATPTSAQ